MNAGSAAHQGRSTSRLAWNTSVFRGFLIAAAFSAVGSYVHRVAASWQVLELTNSPFLVGLVTGATGLPALVLMLPAGALADSVRRRTVLLFANSVMAASAAVLSVVAAIGLLSASWLVVMGLSIGIGFALSLPSTQAAIADLVAPDLVSAAVSLNSASHNIARFVGPVVGGWIVAASNLWAPYLFNAVTFLGVVAWLWIWKDSSQTRRPLRMVASIRNGIRLAMSSKVLLRRLALLAGFMLLGPSVQALLPHIVSDRLGAGAPTFGLLVSMMGLGAIGGGLTREQVARRVGGRLMPSALGLTAICSATIGWSSVSAITAIASLFIGTTSVWVLATINSVILISAPLDVRGRMMSLYSIIGAGLLPLGMIALGGLAEALGIIVALTTAALLMSLLALWQVPRASLSTK